MTSQGIRYLDSLDAGNTDGGDSPQVSTADILCHTGLYDLADSTNTLPCQVDASQSSTECDQPTFSVVAADEAIPSSSGCVFASGSPPSPGSFHPEAASLILSTTSHNVVDNTNLPGVSQTSGHTELACVESVPVVSSAEAGNASSSSTKVGNANGGIAVEARAPCAKRSEMGSEERKVLKELGAAKQEKLMQAIKLLNTRQSWKILQMQTAINLLTLSSLLCMRLPSQTGEKSLTGISWCISKAKS